MSKTLGFQSLSSLADLVTRGQISPVEIMKDLLARIERLNPQLGTFITIRPESALEEARTAESIIQKNGPSNPLHGIPIVHKDNIWTKGVRTTAHSKTLVNFVPNEDATAVAKLAGKGMILLGKTNTTEFACGDMDEYGPSRNPWNPEHFSGASSGGSAAALAAGMAIAATGSDTGGSIRAPASMCGIVGVKPTYGRVSRHGLIPLSWSMDNIGPMARTIKDAALLLEAMSGFDALDPNSSKKPVPSFTEELKPDLTGIRIGFAKTYFFENLQPEVEQATLAALQQLEGLGAELHEILLPSAADLAAPTNVLVMSEAFGRHAQNLKTKGSEYGPKARRRIAAGAFYTAAEVEQAAQIRATWNAELFKGLSAVDAFVTPTLPHTAFTVDTQVQGPPDTSWATRHFNLSGYPALTMPCGFDSKGLPIGLQIIAKPFQEKTMFRVGHAYELATEWHQAKPPGLEDSNGK
jgi:aspartyl-tRNA(Asn)/glutamyl-tRNA(Gln) amidotransferase subunit A